jgi:hypothetical protein
MLAHAFLAVATAAERDHTPIPNGVIALTINEFRRLFAPSSPPSATQRPACCTGRPGADDTNTEPANVTTDATKTNDHDLRLR